ncbi:MAG: co-chaperone GroES [Candidatus Vogelbacteria bacterium]|nr:co-chaperone GroES [Candidatus Vogelbacteria bacterium]
MSRKINIKPLGDRVLVEPILEDSSGKSKHGIIIPETVSKEKAEQGLILAVGDGRLTDTGKILPLRVKKGQKVIFAKYGPDEIKVDDKEYYIISESSILAIIE